MRVIVFNICYMNTVFNQTFEQYELVSYDKAFD